MQGVSTMKFKDSDISLSIAIEHIAHIPIYKFTEVGPLGNSPITEYKEVRAVLNITISNTSWQVPYLLIFQKTLKNEFLDKYNIEMNGNDECFDFFRKRYLNVPLFELNNEGSISNLVEFLMILDLNKVSTISNQEYNFITADCLLTEKDKTLIQNSDNLKYCIKKYHRIAKKPQNFFSNREMWKVPHIALVSRKSDIERLVNTVMKDTNEIISSDSYTVIPYGYSSSFLPSFKEVKESRYVSPLKSQEVFSGSYAECKSCLSDNTRFNELLKRVYKFEQDSLRRSQQEDSDAYYNRGGWERDYFDAMTDGQLGDYDDFKGDIDDIDTWSRG